MAPTRLLVAAVCALAAQQAAGYQIVADAVDAAGNSIFAADAAGAWQSAGLGTTGNDLNTVYLRVRRTDGGAIADCTFADANLKLYQTGTAVDFVGLAKGTPVFKGSFWEIPVTISNAVTAAQAGLVDVKDAGSAFTCASVASSASGSALTTFNVGAPLTGVLATTTDVIGSIVDYASQAKVNFIAFNSATSPKLALSGTGIDGSNLASAATTAVALSTLGTYFTYPVAMASVQMIADATVPNTLKLTLTGLDSLLPGVYEFAVKAGTVTKAATVFGGARFRFIVGSIPLVYNAATMRPATQLAGTNASTVIYATNATKLGVAVCGGNGGSADAWYTAGLFSALYDAVYPYSANSAEDVSALFVGYSDASAMVGVSTPVKAANFTLTAAVGEGMYVFHRKAVTIIHDSLATPVAESAQRNLVIVVDRTAPTAADATFSGSTQSVGSAGTVALAAGMFTDAISNSNAKLTVVSTRFIGGDSQGYICSNMVPLSTATCTAAAVRAPAGNLQVAVTVADEAGNEAVAVLTIPVAAALVPVVTVADNRGVFTSTTLKTGSAATLSSANLVLTVVATFTDPLSAAPSLTISDSNSRVASGHLSGDAVISANKRVFTYTVTIAAVAQDDDISIKVRHGDAIRAADSVTNVADSSIVHVKIDTTRPTQTVTVASAFAAAVGQPFFAYIPVGVFTDSGTVLSADADITIVSATTSDTVGLTVTGGKAGRAYISGTAASVPSLDAAKDSACGAVLSGTNGWVKFAVAVADEAGNLKATTGVFCVQVTTIASTASLSVSRNALTYAEDAAAASLDSVAAFSYASNAYMVYISLETPDVGSGSDEILAIAATTGLTMGSYTAATAANGLLGSVAATATSGNAVAASVVQAALRVATYANTMDTLTPGYRTVRIVVTAYDAARQPVLSSVSKTIYVTNVNSVPVVASAAALAVTWSEGDSFFAYGQLLAYANAISVTDADDGAGLVSATLRIATTASAGNYGACDPARDSLALPSDYLPAPVVYGVWSAAACALVLKPIAGATATPAQFSAALSAVLYRNSDRYDPTNGVTDTQKARAISIIAIDNAANLKASAPATSVAQTGTITPTLVDDKPFFICEKLYGLGGMGYSFNETAGVKVAAAMSGANLLTAAGCPGDVVIRKTVLPFRAAGSATLVFTIPVDFSLVSSRLFANGAMYDYDTLAVDTSINAAAVTLAIVDSVGAAATPAGITVPSALTAYTSATGVGSFTITIAEASALKGEFGVKVTYGSSGNKFVLWFDVRARVCVSDVTAYGAATTLAVLASNYILDPNECSALTAAFSTSVDAAGSGVASYVPGQYIHMPASAATWSTGSVGNLLTAGKGTGSTFNPNFNFLALNASLAAQRYALENAKVPASVASAVLANARAAARGAISLYFEKNSFSTTSGSFPLTFQPLGWAAAQTLPAGATGEILDANQVFELTPAGMQFAVPMRMHMFVGDTPVGYTRTLRVASRKDITDATRGWQAWEAASGVTFDPATGLLSGNSSHFSAFASFLVPIAASPSVSKVVSMGGSCPNDCSGHGYCRAQGSCECFAGYNGVDCALRTCPVAESWDAGSTAVHEAKECSERGACNGKTGVCACNAGFEGAACQRMACPGNCNSHGKCTLLGHLPQVQGAGYGMWEAARLTKCVCDAGYTGIDCTERICPFGDDPETTCNTDRQVQKVVLDFGSIPASTTPMAAGLYDTDEMALVFQTPFGQNLSVPRISNVFDPSSGAPAFQRALKSLPGFAVSDVAVTGVVAADTSAVTYHVTFDGASLSMALAGSIATRLTSTGNTVPGNQALLICPANSAGSMGCQSPGCRPMYKQARLLQQPSSGVTVSSTAILQQPAVAATVVTTGKWAVIVHVTIRYRAETGTQSYSVTSELYQDNTLTGASLPETPLPPANTPLRANVPLVYGLEVNFDAGTIVDGTYDFSWRLPSCTVTQEVSADIDLELAECSRRGVCDRKAGACKCFSGYAGANCGMQTVVV